MLGPGGPQVMLKHASSVKTCEYVCSLHIGTCQHTSTSPHMFSTNLDDYLLLMFAVIMTYCMLRRLYVKFIHVQRVSRI